MIEAKKRLALAQEKKERFTIALTGRCRLIERRDPEEVRNNEVWHHEVAGREESYIPMRAAGHTETDGWPRHGGCR